MPLKTNSQHISYITLVYWVSTDRSVHASWSLNVRIQNAAESNKYKYLYTIDIQCKQCFKKNIEAFEA